MTEEQLSDSKALGEGKAGAGKQVLGNGSLGSCTQHLSPGFPCEMLIFLLQERKCKTPHPKLSYRPVTTINEKVKMPHEEGRSQALHCHSKCPGLWLGLPRAASPLEMALL